MLWSKPLNIILSPVAGPGARICMVEVVVGREIPQHRLALNKYVVSKKQIISFLALFIKERIVVIALETFNHVTGVACPLVNLPICLHSVYQMRAAILYGDGITMIMIPETLVRTMFRSCRKSYSLHVCEKVDSVCIVIDRCIANDTQGMQLVAKSSLTDDKLSSVSPVEAVDTVGPCYPILHD